MKLLVLNVDRDDDLGRKTGIQAPVIGREAVLAAATSLAVNDPEEADANAMFAAVKEYDEVLAAKADYGADEVFVAAATGHIAEGTRADTEMARQIDIIIERTGADHAILVSDGGEDEHLLPILATRMKVDGVRRVVIKQAKNLEGFVYLFNRLMSDEKLQRRFFLPLAFLLVAAGISIGYNRPQIFLMACLFLAAFYIFVQVFKLQSPIGSFFARIGRELQAGKLSFVASLVGLALIVWGGVQTLDAISEWQKQPGNPEVNEVTYSLLFADFIYWTVVTAVLVVLIGRALDELVREKSIRPAYWKRFTFTLSIAVILRPLVGAARARWVDGDGFESMLTAALFTQIFFGVFLLFVGLIMRRYFQQVAANHRARVPLATPEK